MAPLPQEARKRLNIALLPLTDASDVSMPNDLDAMCRAVSIGCEVAYIEAEYFGGDGIQAFALYQDGELRVGPIVDSGAINEAIAMLGVDAIPERDQFDVVGLGKYRSKEARK